jgi:hypothetical protein
MSQQKIELCVETICNKGCQFVRDDIQLLEQGKIPSGADHLSADERSVVLTELKNIMAVYGDVCRIT